jgi:hypothetical protein
MNYFPSHLTSRHTSTTPFTTQLSFLVACYSLYHLIVAHDLLEHSGDPNMGWYKMSKSAFMVERALVVVVVDVQ